jgi:arylsulfatase A-like enzyme
MSKKLNILFIYTDQMHRYALGCMGTPDIQTPNLDRLAENGVLFTDAYSNCPICTPFRINLFTGLYTNQTNTFGNEERLPNGENLITTLNNGGYHTSYVGKWHIGGSGNGPIPQELRGGFTDFIGYQCYNGFFDDVCFYDEDNNEHHFDRHRTDVTTDLAIERMRGYTDMPFAMFIAYQAPHYPVQPPEEYYMKYADINIKRRPNCQEIDPYTRTWSPRSPWPPEDCLDYQRYGNNLDEYLRLYYAMVTHVDAEVGRLLQELDCLGMAENTVIIFTSDHGDMQGSHGLKNKSLPYEESAGIPLIVRVPGGAIGKNTNALVSGVDYYPTILDLAGLPKVSELPGTSFAPLLRGDEQLLSGPVFSEMQEWKMVRERDIKLVVKTEELKPDLLFDLGDDPYEMNNLVNNTKYADITKELRGKIAAWLEIKNKKQLTLEVNC